MPKDTDSSAFKKRFDISMVVPAYNEEGNIQEMVERCERSLAEWAREYEIICINDKSKDSTGAILDDLEKKHEHLVVIHNEHNIGCHPSTLVGFKRAKYEVVIFLPSDIQLPPETSLPAFLPAVPDYDVVYSNRIKRADPFHRRLVSKTYNLIIRMLFGVRVSDVDSAPLIKKHVLDKIMPDMNSDSAFISVEILVRSRKLGYKIGEVIIEHFPREHGTPNGINIKDLCYVPINLFKFFFHMIKLRRK